MAKVYKYYNQVEASKIKELLESEDIPVELRSFEEWGYDGVFRSQMGMGEILVPDEYQAKAEKIINTFTKEKEIEKVEDKELKMLALEGKIKGSKWEILLGIIYLLVGLFVGISLFLLQRRLEIRIVGVFFGIIFILLAYGSFYSYKQSIKAREELKERSRNTRF